MNQELVQKQLIEWMINFVEKPNPLLNGWAPCPYARAARLNDRVLISFSEDLEPSVHNMLPNLETYDVGVICFDHTKISVDDLASFVVRINEQLMPQNFVILEDHPDDLEYINGLNMNFGHCGLLFIQKLDKLNTAANQLKSGGYYDTWSQENLDQVVNWRS